MAQIVDMGSGLAHAELLRVLLYDPDTGAFVNRVGRGSNAREGTRAGSMSRKGYEVISVSGRRYLAHRLAWFYVHAAWPVHEIDHINGVRHDNRMLNLREVSDLQQQWNRRIQKNNTSGMSGVKWSRQYGVWVAGFQHSNKYVHVGTFACREAAIDAQIQALRKARSEFSRV